MRSRQADRKVLVSLGLKARLYNVYETCACTYLNVLPNPKLWPIYHHFQSTQWTWWDVTVPKVSAGELQRWRLFHACCNWTPVVGNHTSQRRPNSAECDVFDTAHRDFCNFKGFSCRCRCRGLSEARAGWNSKQNNLWIVFCQWVVSLELFSSIRILCKMWWTTVTVTLFRPTLNKKLATKKIHRWDS